jgi:alkanesulfonate monooxygenase SsuD/methylene tetrahydromethanopterin reductase-like flavin-dependent oxidoreductase (luciferase family)
MSDRKFRFGVVATPRDSSQWGSTARRVAELGYSTLLMPDGLQLLSPFSSLAMAASVTGLRVGTFVLAAPLRPPRSAAWEAHSLSVLTDGRFELGIGTGRPAVRQFAQQLGLHYGSAAERLAQVGQTIDYLRELDGPAHTPVLMAAGGPKARALAAAKADIITLATGPLTTRGDVAQMVAEVREHAEDRAQDIELAMNLFVIGEEVPPGSSSSSAPTRPP